VLVDVGDEVSGDVELLKARRERTELVGIESVESVVGETQRAHSVMSTSVERQLRHRRRVLRRAVDRHQTEDGRRRAAKCCSMVVVDVGTGGVADSVSTNPAVHAPVDAQHYQQT